MNTTIASRQIINLVRFANESSGSHNQGFVTDSNGVFIGVVHFEPCSNRDPSQIVKYAAQLPLFTFTVKTNLIEAVKALRIVNLDIALIVSSTDNIYGLLQTCKASK